jgi:ATP-dependent Lon protease
MKESAQAALTYLRSGSSALKIDVARIEKGDIHIHVPAGAIPKDGPSAGITMIAALASALTERPLREAVAMTGEITLRGTVLPVGGIKEKVLAARRANVLELYVPARNRKDVEEIDEVLRKSMTFHYVDHVEDVLRDVLVERPTPKETNGSKSATSESAA